jgi:hypothetical protein
MGTDRENQSIFRYARHGEDIAVKHVRRNRRREAIMHVRRPSPASIYVSLLGPAVPAPPARPATSTPICCTSRLPPALDPVCSRRCRCRLAYSPYLDHKSPGRCPPPDRWRRLGSRVANLGMPRATCTVCHGCSRPGDQLGGTR